VSELSDKLKSLGVKVGAQDVRPPEKPAAPPSDLEIILGGAPLQTRMGETYLVEARYPTGQSHGRAHLALESPRRVLAEWARDPRLADLAPAEFAFLDTETTGLSGGTGTYAFLVGAARFEQDGLHLAQFFMRDPQEEIGLLAALEEFLAPCRALVTFNGKSFDAPLLRTRYAAYQWQPPLNELVHVDLMHLAQRLWRKRLSSYTLKMLEAHILGAERDIDDVPGWEIPEIYFTYLHDHDPEPLKRVFYHNAMDVISLAALLDHMAGLLDDPQGKGSEYGADLIALARLYEDLGDQPAAAQLYEHGLDHQDARSEQMPRAARVQGLRRLAAMHKHNGDWPAAIKLWEQAAGQQDLEAHIELAMCYEHTLHDLPAALRWTQAAISLVAQGLALTQDGKPLKPFERRQRLADLEHRLERLERKQKAAIQNGK
jgi:uncharacterized protein YprB with RNaseH-like and TPR domain